MTVHDEAVAIADDLRQLRREIHREPEVGLDLPKTQCKVLAALDGLPLEVTVGRGLSSVTAVLRGGRPGRTVLLRGDMDALPLAERTGLDFSSLVDGAAHACGHDLHTAMLAGAARLLAARQSALAGNVIFMFQPGEESGGGAKLMIDEGVLDAAGERPAAAYALHVVSSLLPAGICATKPGQLMAACDVLHVTVRGRGGHGSQPHDASDPIPAACAMVTGLQTMVTSLFDVFDPVIVTVCSFHAGSTSNVIPDEARFVATVRSFSAASRDRLKASTVRLVTEIAAAHGVRADADYADGYPVTVNEPGETAFAEQTAISLFGGARFIGMPNPVTASEDFSFVLNQVPGAYLMMGACPADADPATAPFNHAADAVFDDSVLADGAALLAELAIRRLAAED
jgi:amidohydrolase